MRVRRGTAAASRRGTAPARIPDTGYRIPRVRSPPAGRASARCLYPVSGIRYPASPREHPFIDAIGPHDRREPGAVPDEIIRRVAERVQEDDRLAIRRHAL